MHTYIAKSSVPVDAKNSARKQKEITVRELPLAADGEAKQEYVIGVKQEYDRVYQLHLLGVTFQRFIRPTDASLAENMDDDRRYGYQSVELTEKQVKALKTAATEREMHFSRSFDWRKKCFDEGEKWVSYADMVYITPRAQFNPLTVSPTRETQEEEKPEIEKIAKAVYDTQGKRK